MDVIFLLKSKQDIFRRFSNFGCRVRQSPGHGKDSLRDSLIGSCPVIDAEFIEVSEDPAPEEAYSAELDSELLKNLREYLRTRSREEITEIFEEIRKNLEERTSGDEFTSNCWEDASVYEKMRMKEIPGRAFRTFSKTACCGKDQILKISKTVSSKASAIASEGRESVKVSSKILNDRWSNLSPRDRKLISETIITVIELGLLKNSTRGKKAAFVVLSSIYKHQTPGRRDMEDFIEEVSRRLKRRR
jgi:predicted house-cleaning noncanonical NTP pyrophosphatase (MazG superfamily)